MDDDIGFVLKPAKENIGIQLPIRKVETESVFVYCLVVYKSSSSLNEGQDRGKEVQKFSQFLRGR